MMFNRCLCYDRYQGGDCSERICPFGLAWSDQATATDTAHNLAECSNRGLCDRTTGNNIHHYIIGLFLKNLTY